MDAPELAEVPEPPSPAAFAQDSTEQNKAEKPKREARAPVRKRPRAIAREHQEPAFGFAQNGNGGYRPWGGGWF